MPLFNWEVFTSLSVLNSNSPFGCIAIRQVQFVEYPIDHSWTWESQGQSQVTTYVSYQCEQTPNQIFRVHCFVGLYLPFNRASWGIQLKTESVCPNRVCIESNLINSVFHNFACSFHPAQGAIPKGSPEGCQRTIMSCLRRAGRKAWGGKGHSLAHSPMFTTSFWVPQKWWQALIIRLIGAGVV